MREIKFRAFRKYPEPQMLYFTLEDIVNLRKPVDVIQEFPKIKDTLMQYTGLRDKNDREIYEGDIVKIISQVTREFVTGKVICQYGYFAVEYGFNTHLLIEFKDIEIIGDIYDNPGLLKEVQ
ncbi:hypothetical protein FDF74_11600 [Clostridium niameyense]|uniref:YopX protein domain-containing protein n=1 Tax=Clostridium niameyense TaxID=1622073 RepID=A0A6M0RC47_9CLOT|nr:YopX family protein [Clostridium niameyense]NEZ47826.1 hypothetical protein [Clostridium niameyense]